ncbi:MAG: hypothetical protein EKK61_04210 [Rickettsiales bacterium]|nr:MAG: hypothetical protein EKK61_04210 [Rickettsiales bacterium]
MSGDHLPNQVTISSNACCVVIPIFFAFVLAISISVENSSVVLATHSDIALLADSMRLLLSTAPLDDFWSASRIASLLFPTPSASLPKASLTSTNQEASLASFSIHVHIAHNASHQYVLRLLNVFSLSFAHLVILLPTHDRTLLALSVALTIILILFAMRFIFS